MFNTHVKAHIGIAGNELADSPTKEATESLDSLDTNITILSFFKATVKKKLAE